MHVLPSTWPFKIKCFPNGLIKKFKSCFCVHCDHQKEGVDYFETWAPVAQWSTICCAMVLTAKLNLKSVHCDITAAFLHAELPEREHTYVHQPCGFKRHPDHVLKLQCTLYGLKQAPRYFFKHLTDCLKLAGYKQSCLDPCLFHAKESIIIF